VTSAATLDRAFAPVHPLEVDEAAARRSLRVQIERLELETSELVAAAHPVCLDIPSLGAGSPRLLGLGELESLRDSLAERLEQGRRSLVQVRSEQQQSRMLVEEMLADPDSYRFVRVSREQVGLPGCGHWHVLPRLGIIGMMMGWWQVKISSGCPLPCGSGSGRA
jgi:hypothetical protein